MKRQPKDIDLKENKEIGSLETYREEINQKLSILWTDNLQDMKK